MDNYTRICLQCVRERLNSLYVNINLNIIKMNKKAEYNYIVKSTDRWYKIEDKFKKFLTTKSGIDFIKHLHTSSLKDLCNRYHCEYILVYKDVDKTYGRINQCFCLINNAFYDDDDTSLLDKHLLYNIKDSQSTGKWNRDKFHKLPKNMTTGRQKLISYHTPMWLHNCYGGIEDYGWNTKRRELSDAGLFNNRYTYNKYFHSTKEKDLFEEKYRIALWDKINKPSPETLKMDLFPKELKESFDKRRNQELNKIRIKIKRRTKVIITGAFIKNNKYIFKQIGKVDDKKNEMDNLEKTHEFYVTDKEPEIMRKVQNIVNNENKKNPNLIQAFIQNKDHTQGRVLIPKAA